MRRFNKRSTDVRLDAVGFFRLYARVVWAIFFYKTEVFWHIPVSPHGGVGRGPGHPISHFRWPESNQPSLNQPEIQSNLPISMNI